MHDKRHIYILFGMNGQTFKIRISHCAINRQLVGSLRGTQHKGPSLTYGRTEENVSIPPNTVNVRNLRYDGN